MKKEKYHILFKKSFLILMDDEKTNIKKFIKENNLKFKDTKDYILVVKEYERLVNNARVE